MGTLDSTLRPLKDIPITDDDMVKWVMMNTPSHEREAVRSVPVTTLDALYPDFRKYGPNAQKVDEFIRALPLMRYGVNWTELANKHQDNIFPLLPFTMREQMGDDVYKLLRPDHLGWTYYQAVCFAVQIVAIDGYYEDWETDPGRRYFLAEAIQDFTVTLGMDFTKYQFVKST